MKMFPSVTICLFLLLSGCATKQLVEQPESIFADRHFAPPAAPIRTADIFRPTPAMIEYAHRLADRRWDGKSRGEALFDALYKSGGLKIEYDSAITRNASEAYEARAGNCLSLAIMTAAIANEMGLTVGFQSVRVPGAWARDGNLFFVSGHVNITLAPRRGHFSSASGDFNGLLIDFQPLLLGHRQNAKAIAENTIVAMYLNNRAAEMLARGNINDAYWSAREAIRQDGGFVEAYNTLGVIYRRHGLPAEAENVFRMLVARDDGNTVALSNLANALAVQGRNTEAEEIKRRLARLEPYPPYHFFDRGMTALGENNYRLAREFFQREVDRAVENAEFHYWLGVAHAALGEMKPAQQHLAAALENSTTRREHDIYAAKLGIIKARSAGRMETVSQ